MDSYVVAPDDLPLLREALLVYDVIVRAEAAVETNALALACHGEQSQRATELAAAILRHLDTVEP